MLTWFIPKNLCNIAATSVSFCKRILQQGFFFQLFGVCQVMMRAAKEPLVQCGISLVPLEVVFLEKSLLLISYGHNGMRGKTVLRIITNHILLRGGDQNSLKGQIEFLQKRVPKCTSSQPLIVLDWVFVSCKWKSHQMYLVHHHVLHPGLNIN